MRTPAIPSELRLLPFRGSEAVAAGLVTWGQLRHGGWTRLFPDVYVCADVPLDHWLWCHAALVYARGVNGVALSGLSAAFAQGVYLLPLGDPRVELTLPPGRRLTATGPRLHVVRSELDAADVLDSGLLAVTSPVRTGFDLARRLPRMHAVAAIDALLNRRVVRSALEIVDKHPALRGTARATAVVSLAEPRSESLMESRCRLVLIDGGLPRPVAQHEVYVGGLFIARLDLAYPHRMVGIEYEGDYHRERQAFRNDIARGNRLRDFGWTIVRVTADDVLRNPQQLVARVRSLIR